VQIRSNGEPRRVNLVMFWSLLHFATPMSERLAHAPSCLLMILRKQAQKEREGRSGFASTKGRQSLKKGFGVKLGVEDARDKDFGSNFGGLVASAPGAVPGMNTAAKPPDVDVNPQKGNSANSSPARAGGFGHGGRVIRRGGVVMTHSKASEGAPVLPEKMPTNFNMPKKGNPFE